ncbi:MAG: lysylphosphatidylglycerol synthase transmembrane domain-containing protein [bacterium]|nr:lysylphosphatidylglycerol synthase transmembrane domain-containing protein [bacterium]
MSQPLLPGYRFRSFLQFALGLAVCIFFLWLAFRKAPVAKIIAILGEAHFWPVAAAIALQMTAHLFRSLRWKIILDGSGRVLRVHTLFAATLVGYAVNVFVPRGGEIARTFFLRRISRTPLSAGLSSVLAERLLDVVSLVLLFFLGTIFYRTEIYRLFPNAYEGVLFLSIGSVLGLFLLWLLVRFPRAARDRLGFLLRLLSDAKREKIISAGRNFIGGIGGIFRKKNAAGILLSSVLVWLFYIFANWILFAAIPFESEFRIGWGPAMLTTLVLAISFAIPSPGGTGTTHYFISALLISILPVSGSEALAFATLLHATSFIPSLLAGILYATFMRPDADNPDVLVL